MSRPRLTVPEARRVLLAAQGLPGHTGRDAAGVVRDHGFVRSLGGVDVYVAVRARAAGLERARLDAAVAAGEAALIPAVRGCMYLVARRHRPWALALADALSRRRFERECETAGIRAGELEAVGEAVLAALAGGPLTTHALRAALPDGLVRSLGEAGKKVGISSPLPPALRRLEFSARVERAHEDGRLDSERYVWRLPAADPFAEGTAVPAEPTALHRDMAALFFRWAGLGTADEFAAWCGLGKRDARQAAEALELVAVEVDGWEGTRLAFAEALAAADDEDGAAGGVALLPFEDNLVHLQGGPAVLVEPEHHGVEVPRWGRGKPTALGEARHMSFRSVVAGGRIVGFWEYDPDGEEIVLGLFDDPGETARAELRTAADDLARFLRDDVGHGRSFSLDTEDDLRARCGRLRGMGQG